MICHLLWLYLFNSHNRLCHSQPIYPIHNHYFPNIPFTHHQCFLYLCQKSVGGCISTSKPCHRLSYTQVATFLSKKRITSIQICPLPTFLQDSSLSLQTNLPTLVTMATGDYNTPVGSSSNDVFVIKLVLIDATAIWNNFEMVPRSLTCGKLFMHGNVPDLVTHFPNNCTDTDHFKSSNFLPASHFHTGINSLRGKLL